MQECGEPSTLICLALHLVSGYTNEPLDDFSATQLCAANVAGGRKYYDHSKVRRVVQSCFKCHMERHLLISWTANNY